MNRNIDELNNLTSRVEKPEDYFGAMDLTKEQIEQRIEYAYGAFTIYDLILIMFLTMQEYNDIDEDYLKTTFIERITSLIAGFATPDDYLINYAITTADDFIDTTIRNQDDIYTTSEDRALFNAEQGANAVLNYIDYQIAVELGETYKTWKTENDNKVRATHQELNGKKIAIDKLFDVGGVKMRFPMDSKYGLNSERFAKETVNCRCTVKYSSKQEI